MEQTILQAVSAFNRSRLLSKINGYLMVHRRLLFWQQKKIK